MRKTRHSVPATVYILADNLDSALAAGEDLVKAGANWPDGTASEPAIAGARRWALNRMRTHELSLITHILQARKNAVELAREAHLFRSSAHLFQATLTDFEDIGEECRRQSEKSFDGGTDLIGFLRERGLIATDTAGTLPVEPLKITDTYLLAGKMPLGVVLDLVSEFLDALDIQYDLYPENIQSDNGVDRAA